MLVTIWGPENAPTIFDYSWREWSGLISTYYQQRWKMFYDHLAQCLADGTSYQDPKNRVYGREAFRANPFYNQLADWELRFIHTHHPLPSKPQGDEIETAKHLLEKYTPLIKAAYAK